MWQRFNSILVDIIPGQDLFAAPGGTFGTIYKVELVTSKGIYIRSSYNINEAGQQTAINTFSVQEGFIPFVDLIKTNLHYQA